MQKIAVEISDDFYTFDTIFNKLISMQLFHIFLNFAEYIQYKLEYCVFINKINEMLVRS